MAMIPPRVVVVGIGQYGSIVSQILADKNWPIVAAYNRAGAKVGRKLGEVTGVEMEFNPLVQDLVELGQFPLEADVAIVTLTDSLSLNFPVYERLLTAGVNVLCLGTESYFPQSCNAVIAEQIDALAERHGVTFTGTGIWDMSRIWSGMLAAGPCTKITSIHHRSLTNGAGQLQSAEQAERLAGIGLSVAEFEARGYGSRNPTANSYRTIVELVVHGMGYTISESNLRVVPSVLEQDLDIPLMGRVIPAGDCVGSKVICELETTEGLIASADIDLRLCHPGETEYTAWNIVGKPSNRIRIERDDARFTSPAILVNRIGDVMAAPPGIRLITDLGPVKHRAEQ